MNSNTELIIYTTDDGVTKVEATFDGDTVWLSQEQMGELFQRDKSTISRHIRTFLQKEKLDEKSGCCRNCNNQSSWCNEGEKLRIILQEFIILMLLFLLGIV